MQGSSGIKHEVASEGGHFVSDYGYGSGRRIRAALANSFLPSALQHQIEGWNDRQGQYGGRCQPTNNGNRQRLSYNARALGEPQGKRNQSKDGGQGSHHDTQSCTRRQG